MTALIGSSSTRPSSLVLLWLRPLYHQHLFSLVPRPPPPSLSAFYLSFFEPPLHIFSSLRAQPWWIKARKELAGPSDMQFVSLQGTNSLREKPLVLRLMKPVWMLSLKVTLPENRTFVIPSVVPEAVLQLLKCLLTSFHSCSARHHIIQACLFLHFLLFFLWKLPDSNLPFITSSLSPLYVNTELKASFNPDRNNRVYFL